MLKRLFIVFTLLILINADLFAQGGTNIAGKAISTFTKPMCDKAIGVDSFAKIMARSITSLHNVFPVRIGSIPVTPSFGHYDHTEGSAMPLCFCGSPFPRIGLKIQLWEPLSIVEVTKLPLCFPSFGFQLPFPGIVGTSNIGQRETSAGSGQDIQFDLNSYQAHYIKFPLFLLLNIFLDVGCLELSGFDIGYFTEIDPTWQNDMWATVMFPESYLVSNMIAQLGCIADATAVQFNKPIDSLFWCMGSWGGTYPVSQNTAHTTDVTASAATVAKMIMKLHRELLLWGTYGSGQGVCKKLPMPIWRKSQYGIFPVFPRIKDNRFPIGKSELFWGSNLDIPFVNHGVWAYFVYAKRFCCLL